MVRYFNRTVLWKISTLATPIQVFVCTITEKANEYALSLINDLQNHDIRCDIDLRNEKGYKIREHSENGCPIILIVGEKEKECITVAIRRLGSNKQEFILFCDFLKQIN